MDDVGEFDAAMHAAMDPQREPVGADVVERFIQETSWWHPHTCTTCGHTFRVGDRVRFERATGRVRHLDPVLGCWTGSEGRPTPPSATDVDDLKAFLDGIDDTWRVAGNMPVIAADEDAALLEPPLGGLARQVCLHCAHSFRPGELVVVCPCHPQAPECHYAVHRDPGRGLVCWEKWRPTGVLEVCPVTQRRLTAPAPTGSA
nr:hypothetical protein GCM10020063_018660 [Dactylosporangium thailandense]